MTALEQEFMDKVRAGKYTVDLVHGMIISAHTGKPLGCQHPLGYVSISIHREPLLLAHRLIWTFAHGEIAPHMVINHKNGNKRDNRLDNLECVTSRQNNIHAHRVLGLGFKGIKGEINSNAKLKEADISRIRELYATGQYTQPQVGAMFGVSRQTVSNIVLRKSWTN